MTRSDRSFPVGPRLLALCVALAALLFTVPVAGAAPPSEGQVENAKQAVADAQAYLAGIQSQVAAIQARLDAAIKSVEKEQSALEAIQAQIEETKARIERARERYEAIRGQLNDRAAQAFMSGPSSGLEFLLGATSIGDLSDRLEFVDAVSEMDAALAQQVANLQAELKIEEANLEKLEAQQEERVKEVEALRDQILKDMAQIQALQNQAAAYVRDKIANYQSLSAERKDYLKNLEQQSTTTGPPSVSLPPGYVNPLKVCPVDPPRAFGDGFGAPRYVGGFHLHGGDDILSDYGTPIRAPFDGTARPTYNTLGGNSEYVYGAQGYVYNAHLDHYSNKSNGPVKAGDIIGYVGDTGDATGTPHDHFEWHPNVIQANWPASSYGYSVIGSAVNPYPMLYDVCY